MTNSKISETVNSQIVERLKSLKVERLFNINKPFNCCNNAFTLAEVLITLGVIGVVAAITMPMLITNINDRANSERHANIAYKMTQAMEQMRAHGKLTSYDSTSAFVDELQKYLKITKRCDADHIAECWPTSVVTNSDGEKYNISDCKYRMNLLEDEDDDENVGLILADGASIILTYDSNAPAIDIGEAIIAADHQLPVGNGKWKSFPYTTNVTGAIDFIMDVNGKKGPNSETLNDKYFDIRSFRGASFNVAKKAVCENGPNGCILYLGTYSPVDCTNTTSKDFKKYCTIYEDARSLKVNDYWAGAKKACKLLGMEVPDVDTAWAIFQNQSKYNSLSSLSRGFTSSSLWTKSTLHCSGGNGYVDYCAQIIFSGNNTLSPRKSYTLNFYNPYGVVCVAK